MVAGQAQVPCISVYPSMRDQMSGVVVRMRSRQGLLLVGQSVHLHTDAAAVWLALGFAEAPVLTCCADVVLSFGICVKRRFVLCQPSSA